MTGSIRAISVEFTDGTVMRVADFVSVTVGQRRDYTEDCSTEAVTRTLTGRETVTITANVDRPSSVTWETP